jgi:tetratricopeptide (TPR) repeat protein
VCRLGTPLTGGLVLQRAGILALAAGELEVARDLLERSTIILTKIFGTNSPKLVTPILNAAKLAEAEGDVPRAAKLYSTVVSIADPNGQAFIRAVAQNNLGELYRKQKCFDEARELLTQSRQTRLELFGYDDETVATTLNNLGNLCGAQEDYVAAESFYQQSYSIRKEILRAPHPHIANSLNNIGWVNLRLNRTERAGKPLRAALSMWEELFGPSHSEVATTLGNLADLYSKIGEPWRAIKCSKRALAIKNKSSIPETGLASDAIKGVERNRH